MVATERRVTCCLGLCPATRWSRYSRRAGCPCRSWPTARLYPRQRSDNNMSEVTDKRSDTTREQILRAAAHQFAQRPYYAVDLDDILAEAQLTKGAMYFHFRSKHALALAIVDEQTVRSGAAVKELFTRKLSGLETLIDVSFLITMADITEDIA